MKTVYLVGVFDMMHYGHYKLFENASKYGDLIVGVVKDEVVRKQKGNNRPIINENQRLYMVRQNKNVFYADIINDFIISNEAIEEFDYIVLGEDQAHIKNTKNIPEDKKIILKRTEGVSTSDLIKRMNNG